MHETHSTSAEGLVLMLLWLYVEGDQVVSASDLLGFSTNPGLAKRGKVYKARAY